MLAEDFVIGSMLNYKIHYTDVLFLWRSLASVLYAQTSMWC